MIAAILITLAAIAFTAAMLVLLHFSRRFLIPVTTRQEAHALADEARARLVPGGRAAGARPAVRRVVPGGGAPTGLAPDRAVAERSAAFLRVPGR